MKKIGDLMKELGFNKEAPDSVKEAFIKHLIKASAGVNTITPSEKNTIKNSPNVSALAFPEQLSFDFLKEDPILSPNKKAVS